MAYPAEHLILRPSRTLQWALPPVYGAVLVAPFLSRLPFSVSVVLAALVCWHGYRFCRREIWLQTQDAVVALRWDSHNRWFMTLKNGRELPVAPGPRSLLLARLCLLELRPQAGGRPRRVPLLADSGDPDTLRRLRVRLRFASLEEVSPSRN